VTGLVSSNEVEASKPAPDIFGLALERAGVGPERALVVGDTVWDVQAAAASGLRCIGVRSGGISEAELVQAGAIAVYDDAAALAAGIDDSPFAALAGSPRPRPTTQRGDDAPPWVQERPT
jgi:phosphoglycolate phosphatase-like HAD superfamily hydrolase